MSHPLSITHPPRIACLRAWTISTAWIISAAVAAHARAGELNATAKAFMQNRCFECHDADSKKGGLDLTAMKWDLDDGKTLAEWVKVHDRVRDGEMPPKKKGRPPAADITAFLKSIAEPMIAADRAREAAYGRSTLRRLNRYEYEETLRDLLDAPWLPIKDMLPEDGESYRFNKVGDALDVSHVQMSRYLNAADYALRQVMAAHTASTCDANRPLLCPRSAQLHRQDEVQRLQHEPRARDLCPARNAGPARRACRDGADHSRAEEPGGARSGSVRRRRQCAMSRWNAASTSSKARRWPGITICGYCAYSFWAGATDGPKWWKPDRNKASAGRRPEPVTLYSETVPRLLRRLGSFDVNPEPTVLDLDVWLLAGETIRPDAARLFRSRPPNWHNPLAEKDGQPGVAYRWLEVQGPIYDQWPTAGHQILFGDLPLKESDGAVEVVPTAPRKDAERLLRAFLQRAYRHPVSETDVNRFLNVITGALDSGSSFADAMITGYSAVLCSPTFLYLKEKPGRLDDFALAERLSYFLWNSEPDQELHALPRAANCTSPRFWPHKLNGYWPPTNRSGSSMCVSRLLARSPQDQRHRARWHALSGLLSRRPAGGIGNAGNAVVLCRASARRPARAKHRGIRFRDAERTPRRSLRLASGERRRDPPGETSRRQPARRAADAGERLKGYSQRHDDVARAARRLGDGAHPRQTAAQAPAQRSRDRARHPRRHDHPRATRQTPHAGNLLCLPCEDRPRRLRAGKLRRHGWMARPLSRPGRIGTHPARPRLRKKRPALHLPQRPARRRQRRAPDGRVHRHSGRSSGCCSATKNRSPGISSSNWWCMPPARARPIRRSAGDRTDSGDVQKRVITACGSSCSGEIVQSELFQTK